MKQSDKKSYSSCNQYFTQYNVNFPGPKISPSDLPWRKPLTKLNSVNDTSSSSTTPKSTVKSTTSNADGSSHVNEEQSTKKRTEEAELSSSTVSTVANKSKTTETELVASQEPNSSKLIIALIPTIVIFVSLFISGVIACLFRKKICKKRNKIKKDDMVSCHCGDKEINDCSTNFNRLNGLK